MKTTCKIIVFLVLGFFSFVKFNTAFADVVEMSNGQTLSGTIIQTNGGDVLVLTRYTAFEFSKTNIRQVTTEPVETGESSDTVRLPDFQKFILFLSQQSWATNITPIPATVIDAGILKNVPYTSFRCGGDYEVNVYGDMENPAGIEIGIYRKLLVNDTAKSNCVNFIGGLLTRVSDREIVQVLNLKKDLITTNDLTFEITPPTAEDAYGGWWISIYSKKLLDLSRASDEDMRVITVAKTNLAIKNNGFSSWSANEMGKARPSKTIITFTKSSGEIIRNAEVVRVIDGVSLIWRNGPTSGGMVRLADLPQDLQIRFGYDEAKTKAADDLTAANNARWRQEAAAAAEAQAKSQYSSPVEGYPSYRNSYSGDGSSNDGGRVYVHGYTRSNA